jgi:glycosyltransferase involved in cell wall biosynthesis
MPSSTPIIIASHEFRPRRGGIATYVAETALALASTGSAPVEIWHGGPEADLTGTNGEPIALRRIRNQGSLNWPCLWRTGRFLRRHRTKVADSILCLPEPGPIFTYLYVGPLRLPWPRQLVLILHGSEILRLASLPHRRLGFKRILERADIIGVVSEYTRGLLETFFPGHSDRVVVVRGALPSGFRHPPTRSRSAKDSELRVLTVARLHPRKGLHHTLAALARLPKELRQRVVYQAVGPATRPAYAKKLDRLAQAGDVRFEIHGDVRDHRSFYADADIFAMTSERSHTSVEGFGLVYLEAGACGLPVVAHDTGGVGEAVRHEKTGLLVTPGDVPGLTSAFERLLKDAALRRNLGDAGQARAKEHSWQENVAKLFPADLG